MAKRVPPKSILATAGILTLLAVLAIQARRPLASSLNEKAEPSAFPWHSGLYAIKFSVENQFDLGAVLGVASNQATAPQISQSRMGIQGNMALKSHDEDRSTLWFENADFDSISYDGMVASDLQSIAGEMQRPIELRFSPNGSFAVVNYEESCRQICMRVWSSILASMQIIQSDSGASGEWHKTEHTMDASLTFSYRQESGRLQKTLTSIHEFAPLKQIAGRLQQKASGEYIFNQDRNDIKGVKGGIDLSFTHEGALVYARKESISMNLTEKNPDAVPAPAPARMKMTPWAPGGLDKLSEKVATEDAWRRELGEVSLDDLKASLQQDLPKEEEIDLYKKIRAFLYLNPERSREFLTELSTGEYNGSYNRLVAVALGRVGHEQAQTVLMEAIQERIKEDREALNFIPLLAQTEMPSKATVDFLERLATEKGPYKNTATLAYGRVLGPYASSQPQMAAKKLSELLDQAERSQGDERELYISAIGNSAQAQAFPRLKPLLEKETNMETLASGMKALRRMADPEVTAYLKANINHPQPKVQAAIWESLGHHPYYQDLEAAARSQLSQASNENAQLAAMSWIWEQRAAVSGVIELFHEIRKNEQLATSVRKQAQSYADLLARYP